MPIKELSKEPDLKISNEQLEKVLATDGKITPSSAEVETAVIKLVDKDLIADVVQKLNEMPDREHMIADLKTRIEAGAYNPSGEDIADAMIRRTVADRIR